MEATAANPNREAAQQYLRNGTDCIQRGNLDEAVTCFRTAVSMDTNLSHGYLYLFQIYQQQGNHDLSLDCLLKATQIDAALVSPEVHVGLANYCNSSGNLDEAIRCCERALQQQSRYMEAHQARADLLVTAGRIAEALRGFKRILKLDPELTRFSNQKHTNATLPYRIGILERQWRDLDELIQATPEVLSEELSEAEELYHKGNSHVQQGSLGEAVKTYKSAILLNPDFAEAHFNLGKVLLSFAKLGVTYHLECSAITCFEKVVALRPEWAESYYFLGKALRTLPNTDSGHYQHLLQLFYKATDLDTECAEAYLEIWDILHRLGRVGESSDFATKYVQAKNRKIAQHPLGKLGIRFVKDFTYAVGHLAESADVYIKSQELGWIPKQQTVLLAPPWFLANPSLLSYWEKYFQVVTDEKMIAKLMPLAKQLHHDVSFVTQPNGKVTVTRVAKPLIQTQWESQKRAPLLALTPEHEERGWQCLERHGIPRDSWFVILHVREPGFKSETNCQFNAHRNADIMTYLPAIKTIADAGGWVIRIGESSMKPLPPLPRVVDYAHTPSKSDWMDVFLCAKCKFYFASSGGIFGVVQTFGRPVCNSNVPMTPLQSCGTDLFIPKLIQHVKENRLLTFKETLTPPLLNLEDGAMLAELGVKLIDSSPDEIVDLAKEMIERVQDRCVYSAEDNALQERYKALIPPDNGLMITRVGRAFLRKYSYLL